MNRKRESDTQKPRRHRNTVSVRLPEATARRGLNWARLHGVSGAEALRSLVTLGLGTEKPPVSRARTGATRANVKYQASRASRFANQTIDNISDASATKREQLKRKKNLTKGPAEFRAIRKRTQKLS
jgi:hypothetical protein